MSKNQDLNWLLSVMKMLQLYHCLLFMITPLNNLTNKTQLQTYNLQPYYFQLKKNSIYQRMVGFVNKLQLSDQQYQTDGNVRDLNYNGKFLFPMKYFVSFDTDHHSMYFMSIIFLKDNNIQSVFQKFPICYEVICLIWYRSSVNIFYVNHILKIQE